MPVDSKVQADNILAVTSDLVRRDGLIPGLELMFNPARFLESLHGHLDISQVDDIKLDYLRYKPGMNCLARYQLDVGGRALCAHAKAHSMDAAKKMSKSLERPVIDGILGSGRVLLNERNIIFSTFPNDAKLVSLQSLDDAGIRQRLLGRVFGSESEWTRSHVVEVLNYKPERRYVVRLARADGKAALGKFYSRSGYARAHTISRKLNRGHNEFYPETIGRSKKYAVVAYRWQPGTTLRQLNIDGQLSPSDLNATAESLAEFHASPGKGLSLPDPGAQAGKLDALAEQLGFLLPQLETRARTVARKLARWLAGQAPVSRPVHGDFYDKQAIICEGKASLIDLDAALLGDPLLDLGNYIAHLERLQGHHGVAAADVSEQRELLVGAYERVTASIPVDRLNRYVALALFSLIHHPFRDWEQDWPAQTGRLLTRVESLCGA